ncbi:RNA-binding protein 42 [Sarcoptes scabiei]|nr:RNA-binding protein 42 [Sarcoptes scabiei]
MEILRDSKSISKPDDPRASPFKALNVDSTVDLKSIKPAFVIKTFCKRNKFKFFINVCHNPMVRLFYMFFFVKSIHFKSTISIYFKVQPPSHKLTIEILMKELDSPQSDYSHFTLPIIIKKLFWTKDNSNNPARMTFVVMNSAFYEEISKTPLIKQHVATMIENSCEEKFNFDLDRNSVILKNKKIQLPDLDKEAFGFDPKSMELSREDVNKIVIKSKVDKLFKQNNDAARLDVDQSDATSNDTNEVDDDKLGLNIVLNIQEEIVLIKIKLPQVENLEKCLHLQMNDDRVVLSNGSEMLQDFFLPFHLKYQSVKARIQKKNLLIECPVLL